MPTAPLVSVARMPTTSEICEPYSMRDKIFRPRLSVPRTWLQSPPSIHAGGFVIFVRSMALGSYGASWLAKIAHRQIRMTITMPAVPVLLRSSSLKKRLIGFMYTPPY